MNSIISCLCVVGLVWAALAVIGGLLGRGRNGSNNWGNNSYNNQGWNSQNNWGNTTDSFLGGMGLGWLFGSWGNNDHNQHINNHDTIVDSNNDGVPDTANENNNTDGGWFDWGNNNNDNGGGWGGDNNDNGSDWGGDSGGDSGGGWGGDSA